MYHLIWTNSCPRIMEINHQSPQNALHDLRNKSNEFKNDGGIIQKRMKNCALFQKFSILILVVTLTKRFIYLLSFNFHCIPTDTTTILTLLNTELFQTFNVVEIHTMSQ